MNAETKILLDTILIDGWPNTEYVAYMSIGGDLIVVPNDDSKPIRRFKVEEV